MTWDQVRAGAGRVTGGRTGGARPGVPPTPGARPKVTGRRGRCPGVARAGARVRGRPGRRRTHGHGPSPGSRAHRPPDRGSGPGPACPSTSTGRPRSAHGRPAPSWRAVVPLHTARRAARGHRHCGVHRSPLHSQPDRDPVPVERADGGSRQFPRGNCSTRVGRRGSAPGDGAGPSATARPGGGRPFPWRCRRATGERVTTAPTASGPRESTAAPAPYPAHGRPAGPPDADPLGQDDAGGVGDRGEEDDSCP